MASFLSGPGRPAMLVALAAVFTAGAMFAFAPPSAGPGQPRLLTSLQSARDLAVLLSENSRVRGWPPYGGQNFVLSLIADGVVDPHRPAVQRMFLALQPGERPPHGMDWHEIDHTSLSERRHTGLTVFAGRRNDEADYRLTQGGELDAEPILAYTDVMHERVVIGFADGHARAYRFDDLGIPADGEVRYGDLAQNPMLEKLSDR